MSFSVEWAETIGEVTCLHNGDARCCVTELDHAGNK